MTRRRTHEIGRPAVGSVLVTPVVVSFGLVFVLLAACSSDGRELADPVFPPPATEAPSTTLVLVDELPGEPTEAPVESLPDGTDGRVSFDRLSSPANATAEVTGIGALFGDRVTVDGEPADLLSFDVGADGTFTTQIWIENEGAHAVCVADTWRDSEARRLDDWARQPAEDFAEVFVAASTDGRCMPRTREVPNDALLAAVLAMSGF